MDDDSRFRTLDGLVLELKGLVLVRQLRESKAADVEELAMFEERIESVRQQLASAARSVALLP